MQIPFGSLPGTSSLFLDYVGNWARVERFYGNSYSLEAIVSFARRRSRMDLPHRQELCRCLAAQQLRWGGKAERVDKLANGAVAVLAGQQPGLFTGPLYTIFKALTAIKLAAALDAAGIPAVPVFWIASEDHDFEEISWATVLDRESALHKIRVDLSSEQAPPVGWLRFTDDVAAAVGDCLSSLPASEFQEDLRSLLSAYQPGVSPVDAFARMMLRLFQDSGLILADPLDPGMKAIAAPWLQQMVERNDRMRQAVIAQSRAIAEAGYPEQVKVDDGFTGLFELNGSSRLALKPDQLSREKSLSPNVLTRPLIQDLMFPTAAFVAGPAEITYLAQAAAVYRENDREVTPFYPRISGTLLEARVARALRKYDIRFEQVFEGKPALKRRAVESVQGGDAFARVKEQIQRQIDELRPLLVSVDSTLAGAVDTARQKMMYQVEALETKFINAEARRNEVLEKQLDLMIHSLFPDKKLQERMLNVSSFIARYGVDFVKRLQDSLDLDSTRHQIIEI